MYRSAKDLQMCVKNVWLIYDVEKCTIHKQAVWTNIKLFYKYIQMNSNKYQQFADMSWEASCTDKIFVFFLFYLFVDC